MATKISTTKERLILAFGRTLVQRCQAKNQRGQQCAKTAIRNKSVCRFHGGCSTGPRTKEGIERVRRANTRTGEYAKEFVKESQAVKARLRVIEHAAFEAGLLKTRIRGRKPQSNDPSVDALMRVIWDTNGEV
ncbi:MAG: HGGxSTG domain-containing protein [Betaproteobacteria bacterium]